MSLNPAELLASAGVPAFNCPKGTKMHILNLGTLTADDSWLLRGANTSTLSDPNPVNKRRDLVVLAGLIEHPDMGLILFETGCAENLEVKWGAPLTDIFARTTYNDDMKLPAAIKATGHDIKDVSAIVIGHLHLDHAGGLEHFLHTNIPIYVHEEEFKHACWAVGTGADLGVYLEHYMQLGALNWQTFTDPHYALTQGITLHHAAGHTPGLCMMQVNLAEDGVFLWTTDQYHVKENHELAHPHGWLARDHNAWVKTHGLVKQIERLFRAELIYGHDKETYEKLRARKAVFA